MNINRNICISLNDPLECFTSSYPVLFLTVLSINSINFFVQSLQLLYKNLYKVYGYQQVPTEDSIESPDHCESTQLEKKLKIEKNKCNNQLLIYLIAYNNFPNFNLSGVIISQKFISCFALINWIFNVTVLVTTYKYCRERNNCIIKSMISVLNLTSIPAIFSLLLELMDIYPSTVDSHQEIIFSTLQVGILTLQLLLGIKVISKINEVDTILHENFVKCCKKNNLQLSREKTASVISRTFFFWFTPMIKLGYEKALSMNDLWDLDIDDTTEVIRKKFLDLDANFSLLKRIFLLSKKLLVFQCAFSLCSACLAFAGPFFLNRIVSIIGNPTSDVVSLSYILGLFVCTLTRGILDGQTYFTGRRIGLRIRSILISEVALKCLKKPLGSNEDEKDDDGFYIEEENDTAQKPKRNGNAINLISVDAQKILEVSCYLCYVLSNPLQIIISVVALIYVLGASAIAGIFILFICAPVGGLMGKRIARSQENLIRATDCRIKKTNELLQSIKIVKFFNWEKSFLNTLLIIRKTELKFLKSYLTKIVYFRIIWWTMPILCSLTTFCVYTKVFQNELTATIAFTGLALFNTLKFPLFSFPDIIVKILDSYVSFKRIDKFLNSKEVPSAISQKNFAKDDSNFEVNVSSSTLTEEEHISLIEASYKWERSTDACLAEHAFKLEDLNLRFPRNKLSVICGATGSGKTSLLQALLGEMKIYHGSHITSIADDSVAYVSQQAWLQQLTIRENICFNNDYDSKWYKSVVYACGLKSDFDSMPSGDKTEVGEKGMNLSGGQKQRIALARAVYSKKNLILMDDPLSAVDAPTARHIFNECILKLLKNNTCILVTHAIQLCVPHSEYLVLMENGKTIIHGETKDVLCEVQHYFELTPSELTICAKANNFTPAKHSNQLEGDSKSGVGLIASKILNNSALELESCESEVRITNEEDRAVGSVSFSVYVTYGKAGGGILWLIALVVGFIFAQTMIFVSDYWLKLWASAYDKLNYQSFLTSSAKLFTVPTSPNVLFNVIYDGNFTPQEYNVEVDVNYYLKMYAMIGGLEIFSLFMRLVVLYRGSLEASIALHQTLLERVLKTPMRFFDITPIGRILNRFSRDIQSIDQEIIGVGGDFLINLVSGTFLVSIISIITPAFLFFAPPIAFAYIYVSRWYIRTSRELKRLDSVSRSPIFSHFSQMISGVCTIRAFKSQEVFLKENNARIDDNHKAFFYLWVSNRWLNLRIDAIGAIITLSSCTAIFIAIKSGHVDAGLVGLSLTYTLSFSDALLWIVRFNALLEMRYFFRSIKLNFFSLNSVERINEYLLLEQEPDVINDVVPHLWEHGDIKFSKLFLKYSPELPFVLQNISLEIKGGEKIGIVGRTGAGKSSFSLALFRFVEATSGNIFIDGVDIASLPLSQLRSSLTIIPQDPVLFSGTIRFNLDPFNLYTDLEIYTAMKRSHIMDSSEEFKSDSTRKSIISLESTVLEGGTNYSQGQRQLLCLARALLKKSKIIILDEATASVDHETDAKIQRTIRECFYNCTILCIAHRLRTIIDYDRCLVLDFGKIVEYGKPLDLMVGSKTKDDRRIGPKGNFLKMCQESGEMDLLLEYAKKGNAY
ncbi:hypothetical protein HDU92_006163 [Lobulomyces angularis]|nr:hypothetical protein HDU92_006163 [Lobulomyces angularis]